MDQPPLPPPLPPVKKSGNFWVIMLVLFGLLVVVTVAGLGFFGFQQYTKIKERRAQARVAFSEIENTAADERRKMADALEKGDAAGNDEALARMKDQLQKSAEHMSKDDAAATRALGGYLNILHGQAQTYQAALQKLTDANVFAFGFTDKAGLTEYRRIITEFAAANEKLTDTLRRSEEIARAQLVAAKVPTRTLEATMNGFNQSGPQRQLQLRVRDYDRVLSEQGLAALALLEKSWGRWKHDPASGQLHFEDDATLEAFNQLIEKIQTAAADQEKTQKELAAKLRTTGQ